MVPTLFVSHGAPSFALEPGPIGRRLGILGRQLPRPDAIAVVSAHWQTVGVHVTGSAAPPTIHDFRGFAPALHALRYPAPGHPGLAGTTRDLLRSAGWPADIDLERGLDHGAWVPLLHMFPHADVPVVQVSLPLGMDGDGAWQFGHALAPLRGLGVLIVGSGSLTHGLADFFDGGTGGRESARRFRNWVRCAVETGDPDRVRGGLSQAPEARRVHPTPEHYLPLPVAAAAGGMERAERIDGGWMGKVIAMDAFVFGACGNGEAGVGNSERLSAA